MQETKNKNKSDQMVMYRINEERETQSTKGINLIINSETATDYGNSTVFFYQLSLRMINSGEGLAYL